MGKYFVSFSTLLKGKQNASVKQDVHATQLMRNIDNTLPTGESTVDYVCLDSPADGSCFYHSISILLQGNSGLSNDLRRANTKELQENTDAYIDELKKMVNEDEEEFTVMLHAILHQTSIDYDESPEQWIKNEVEKAGDSNCFNDISWSSILQVMGLATVLHMNIRSIYPAVIEGATKAWHHKTFKPVREIQDSGLRNCVKEGCLEDLIIFWTRFNPRDTKSMPNHVVPVVNMSKVSDISPVVQNTGNTVNSTSDFNQKLMIVLILYLFHQIAHYFKLI